MACQVSPRGQITIDHGIREQLGVRTGMVAHQRVVNGRLEILFLPAPHRQSLFGALHVEGEEPKVATGEQLEEAVMEAIAEESRREGGENG